MAAVVAAAVEAATALIDRTDYLTAAASHLADTTNPDR